MTAGAGTCMSACFLVHYNKQTRKACSRLLGQRGSYEEEDL